jgi:L-alanine-DL-glutamate epimerase-like enolase superfamily enzyme
MSNPNPRLTWQTFELELQNPFRVSYGTSVTRQANWVRLADDLGWGEGTIPPYYGIEKDAMTRYWDEMATRSEPFPDEPESVAAWIGEGGPAPARCALDLALLDRIGRLRNQPLHKLLDLPQPKPLRSSFTVAIDTPEAMAHLAKECGYPIIKVKLGSDDDVTRLAAIRAARPDAELCVDANGGWSATDAVEYVKAFADYQLSFVEQPVPKNNLDGMGYVQSRVDLPIVADESVQTMADIERLAELGVQGINLKLMKVGGITTGLKMLQRAQALGMHIMLGCMVETSLGVTAMAHLAGFADWLDLDAPLLVRNDPFAGIIYDDKVRIHLPDRPGIGVVLK